MKQYGVVKPVYLKGIRRKIGEMVPETEVQGKGVGCLLRMGYLVEMEETEDGPEIFGVSMLPEETDAAGLGKKVKELGTFKMAGDGNGIQGTLNYVSGYTGFNGSDPQEQEGYFLPFGFTLPEGYAKAHMIIKGGKGNSVELDAQNVVYLGKTAEDVRMRSLVITLNKIAEDNPDNIQSAVKEYLLTGLTAVGQQKARKKG